MYIAPGLSLAFQRWWYKKNIYIFFFVLSFIRSIVIYSPTFLSHFHKLQSVFFQMVPRICISLLQSLSYRQLDLSMSRSRVMECCTRWPGLHNPQSSTQLRWFGMSWTAEWRKSSQQVLSIYGNSFKIVVKHYRWSWLRECQEWEKLSSRQRVATLKNLKYI